MQLHGLAAFVDGFSQLAAPYPHEDERRRQRRQERLDLRTALERVERLVELSERGVEERAADERGSVRRPLPQRLLELRLGVLEPMLEHVQAVRAIASQLGSEAAGVHGPRVRLEKLAVDVSRRAHAERREHQVAGGQSFEGAKVGGAFPRRALEAVDRAIGAVARAPVPVVPSGANQLFRCGNLEAVAHLRPVRDPAAVLAQALADFADRDVDGMPRDERAVPGLGHHLLVADGLTTVAQQRSQRLKRLWAELDLHSIAQQARRRGVEQKRSEVDFRHGRLHAWRDGQFAAFLPAGQETMRAGDLTAFCSAFRSLRSTIAPASSPAHQAGTKGVRSCE